MEPRRLAQASRCQLMIGSWTGSPFACPCEGLGACQFTREERDLLVETQHVKEMTQRNKEAYLQNTKQEA